MPTQSMPDGVREPPNDVAAEEAVLGALLLDAEGVGRIPFLRAADFYRGAHHLIFEAAQNLATKGLAPDYSTLVSELERTAKLEEAGGASYLAGLVNATPTAAHLVHYARRVEYCAVCRRMIRAASEMARVAFNQPDDLGQMLADAEGLLLEVRKQRLSGQIITPAERAGAAFDRIVRWQEGKRDGIPYGLEALDRWTHGAEPGQLVVIAGRPGMGKTSFLYTVAGNMSRGVEDDCPRKVLFATVEMPDSQLTDRDISGRVGLTLHQLRQQQELKEEDWRKITDAATAISQESLYTYDCANATTAMIKAAAVEMRARYGLDALAVDYLQLLHDTIKGNDVERLTAISRDLKAIARSLNVPVLVTAQLNRAVEGRDDKMPTLADLRGSGAIEQDADVVLLIYRPAYYSKDANDNTAVLIVGKQRNGPAGFSVPLVFDQRLTRFCDVPKKTGAQS